MGTLGGLGLMLVLSTGQLSALTGVATIVAASLTMLLPAFSPKRVALMGAGLITGVTETSTGIGGPPLAQVYQHQAAATMRSTLAACFLIGELLSLGLLWAAGRTGWQHLIGAGLLVPSLLAGAVISKVTHVHLSPRSLRVFVVAFSVTSGVVLLLRA